MDVAFQMDEVTRAAMCIVFSEQESEDRFDWDLMAFPERK